MARIKMLATRTLIGAAVIGFFAASSAVAYQAAGFATGIGSSFVVRWGCIAYRISPACLGLATVQIGAKLCGEALGLFLIPGHVLRPSDTIPALTIGPASSLGPVPPSGSAAVAQW
jgi:hypothetical protein